MVPKKPTGRLRIWVPVARAVGWPAECVVEDVFGREHHTAAGGPYCFYDDAEGRGRMGLGGIVVSGPNGGVYRVRFGDGVEVLARVETDYQIERAA